MKYIIQLFIPLLLGSCTSAQNNNAGENVANSDTLQISTYPSGKIHEEISMKNGARDGKYTAYHENGAVAMTGTYTLNQKSNLWKSYSPSGQLELVEYYSEDRVVAKPNASDFNFKTYTTPSGNLTLSYPSAWTINTSNHSNFIFNCSKAADKDETFQANLTITVDTLHSDSTMESFIASSINLLKQNYINVNPVAKDEYYINQMPAFQLFYSFDLNGIKISAVSTYLFNGRQVIMCTGLASHQPSGNFLRYKDVFLEITNSIQVKQ